MKSTPPDHAERQRITTELDRSLLVEAAAGTGKTTALVNRIVALVTTGKCARDKLVAVTFTRKAAAELQQRLRGQLPGAEQCLMGTIHSFCGRLLRERPVEAGVDLDFTELDEDRDQTLREQAWVAFTNELFARDDPALDQLEDLGLTPADLRSAFLKFADYPDVTEWPAPATALPDLADTSNKLRDYADHMRNNLPARDGTDPFCALWPQILRMLQSHRLDIVAELAEILELFTPKAKTTQKNWPGGKAQAEAEHQRWDEFCKQVAQPFVAAWRAHRYAAILPLLHRARDVYDRQRAAARALNFQDLLLRAAQLLRDRPEVRRYFRQRFTHILVDEFQDTDPIQAEVLLLLTASDPTERDWRRCRPVPGSLFVVGDPKQSIYRFRRADIVTYNTVKQIIGNTVTLSTNFRSAKPIVDWVNGTFAPFFPATATAESPAYVAFTVGRPAGDPPAGIGRLVVAGENQEQIAAEEPARIARHIRASGRPPGDFLIITRGKKRLRHYAAALQALGIPHEVTGGTSLNQVPELGVLHAVARAALEPDDAVAVVAALRSAAFGCRDAELFAHRQAGGRFDWRSGATGPVGEAFAALRCYADWLGSLAPMIALERIATESGLLVLAATEPAGDVAAGSLAKALELLRAGQAQWPTATELVAQLGRWVAEEEPHDGAPVTAPTGAAVRVMNLHKVKGLQAPVVFLADPCGAKDHPPLLHVDRTTTPVRGYLALTGPENAFGGPGPVLAHPPNWEELAAREKKFVAAEENRLLYVAATRAQDQLIVSLRAKRKNDNPWEPLAAAEAAPLPDPGPQPVTTRTPVVVTAADVGAARAELAARWEAIRLATHHTRAAKPPVASGPPTVAGADNDGMRWGSAIHLLLETVMRAPGCDVTALAVSALRAVELDESLAATAAELARAMMSSTLWRRARAATQRLVEVPLVVALPQESGTVVRAVVDLAFAEADGWVLVDYKTDAVPTMGTLVEKYGAQLRSYAVCWEAAGVGRVKELGIYATRLGRYEVVPR